MSLLLIVIVLVVLFGGGFGGYYSYRRVGPGPGALIWLLAVILLIFLLFPHRAHLGI